MSKGKSGGANSVEGEAGDDDLDENEGQALDEYGDEDEEEEEKKVSGGSSSISGPATDLLNASLNINSVAGLD